MTSSRLNFNANQKFALEWNEGALLVLGGASTGKTTVLTLRIERLINESPKRFWRVLALSVTEKAVADIESTIGIDVSKFGSRVKLSTIHTLATSMLMQHGSHIGMKPSLKVITDQTDRCFLLRKALRKMKLTSSDDTCEFLLPILTRYMEQGKNVGASEIEEMSQIHGQSIAQIYSAYRAILIEHDLVDSQSLFLECLGLMRKISGVRRQYLTTYPYICVDDLHSINGTQYRFLRELVNAETKNLFLVANEELQTYDTYGARSEHLDELIREFSMNIVRFPENYRCPETLVDIANKLTKQKTEFIQYKKNVKPHKLVTLNNKAVKVLNFATIEQEAYWVANSINERPAEEKGKCVVLARNKMILDKILEVIKSHRFIDCLSTRKIEFSSLPLQWLHSILKLANNRSSRSELYKVCRAFAALTGVETNREEIVTLAFSQGGDLLRGWSYAVLRSGASDGERDMVVNAILPMLADRLNHEEFQLKAFEWMDNLFRERHLVNEWYDEYTEEKATWKNLVREIAFDEGSPTIALHHLLRKMDLKSKAPKLLEGAIPCMTIHASKGMEFDHVYLVGMVEDHFPSWLSIKKGDGSVEMEEERRSCFVAITRTQESLHLTYSDEVNDWRKEPSRFLSEMGVLKDAIRPPETRVDSARTTLTEIGDLNNKTATKQKDYKQHPENVEIIAP